MTYPLTVSPDAYLQEKLNGISNIQGCEQCEIRICFRNSDRNKFEQLGG